MKTPKSNTLKTPKRNTPSNLPKHQILNNLEIESVVDTPQKEEENKVLVVQEDGDLKKVLFGKLLLNDEISKSNFSTLCCYLVYLGFILISFGTLEPEYVSQLGVEHDNLGKITSALYLIDYGTRLIFALGYGFMIDHFGRRFVMIIGFVLTSLGYLTIPFLSSSLFPGYFMGKSIYSIGIIALQMLPLSADYIHNSTKGIMAGMNFCLGFFGGALSAIVIKSFRLLDLRFQTIFWILAGVIFVVGILLAMGLKGGNTYYKLEKVDPEHADHPNEVNTGKWSEVKRTFKKVPWVTISMIFGILGSTDLYVMTTGMIIWMKSLIGPGNDPTPLITTYQAIFFGLSVPVTGILATQVDKVSHMKLIFPILVTSILGFIPIPFVDNAFSFLIYLFIVLEGLALPGIFVFSSYLSMRYNPPNIRGTLSGMGNCISFIGAIIVLSAGGFLHDHWRSDASFILYWILLGLTLIIVLFIYQFMIRNKSMRRTPVSIDDTAATTRH